MRLLTLWLVFVPVMLWAQPSIKPSSDLSVVIAAVEQSNGDFEITVTFASRLPEQPMSLTVDAPGLHILTGTTQWQGLLAKDQTKQLTFSGHLHNASQIFITAQLMPNDSHGIQRRTAATLEINSNSEFTRNSALTFSRQPSSNAARGNGTPLFEINLDD